MTLVDGGYKSSSSMLTSNVESRRINLKFVLAPEIMLR